jgi:Tfp pilus assembly protein PilN
VRPLLNLATRPLRNERLPSLLVALAAVFLSLATVKHVLMLKDLMPGRVSALDREAAALEQEVVKLRQEASELRGPRPDPERVNQWAGLRGLVDRRAFSWSSLLSTLESVLPPGVRLVSITPTLKDGQVWLQMSAVARRFEDRQALFHSLQQSSEFQEVFLESSGESELGEEFTYVARYTPGSGAAAPPAAEGGKS